MLKMLDAMLFYMMRWREEQRAKKEALAELKSNHWRCADVERLRANKYARSYRRAINVKDDC